MSTAAVAGSTVREKQAKGETFPEGVAIDSAGQPIIDPAKVMSGTLLPAAGAKGFGLALLVEVLSAVLTGAAISHQVGSMYKNFESSGQNGHFFLAIDISRWLPMEDYYTRIEQLSTSIGNSGPGGSVRMPGDSRWTHFAESERNGILLAPQTLARITPAPASS